MTLTQQHSPASGPVADALGLTRQGVRPVTATPPRLTVELTSRNRHRLLIVQRPAAELGMRSDISEKQIAGQIARKRQPGIHRSMVECRYGQEEGQRRLERDRGIERHRGGDQERLSALDRQ
ncbi:hypothetical protein RHCRD62_60103 [Rhodococcus sp. RD6.2]|nr:hypothetical protein RHCRD62_60103 [Rhodococcus sp. RD6.2]